jgi:hypothetical protein
MSTRIVSWVAAALATSLLCGAAWAQPPANAGPAPESASATDASLAALVRRVEEFRDSHLTAGTSRQLAAQVRRMRAELDRIATQAEALIPAGGGAGIAAHVLRGEAHEHQAYEMSRLGQLTAVSHSERDRFAALESSVTRLDALAAANDLTAPQLEQLRLRAREARDRLEQARSERAAQVQAPFSAEVHAERLRALRRYALAVAMAEHDHATTPFSSYALTRLRQEDYQALLEPAINGIPPQIRRAQGLAYHAGMYGAPLPHDADAANP